MSIIIYFFYKMFIFLSYVKYFIIGVFIIEDFKMLSLYFFKKCIENILENLLVYF